MGFGAILGNRPDYRNRLINARARNPADGLLHRFAEAPLPRIVADGFYEWKKAGSGANPAALLPGLREGKAFVFAGLWESWQPKDDLKTNSSPAPSSPRWQCACCEKVHDRMPVIPKRGKWAWLQEDNLAALKALLKPAPDDLLQAWEVNLGAVNDPKTIRLSASNRCKKALVERNPVVMKFSRHFEHTQAL